MNTSLKPGDRVRLVSMSPAAPDPIPVGTEGRVIGMTDSSDTHVAQVDVQWDNGRTRMLSIPADRATVIR